MSTNEIEAIPNEFQKIIKDFISDILTTFPEYEPIVFKWWSNDFQGLSEEDKTEKMEFIFAHCLTVFPERFIDILYQSEEMFKDTSSANTEFLPGISFKYLWKCDISKATRDTIWKYLQLILLSIVGSMKNKEAFGDTAKLFDSINEDEFKGKLEETLSNMQKMFETQTPGKNDESTGINIENLPNADEIHEHITGMMGGKLGQLAQEIAEETAGSLNIDMANISNAGDIFQTLFSNPGKLMELVKNVGDKLDQRLKRGDIKENELYSEATNLMNKMKDMPGLGNIQDLLKTMGMGMPNLGKNEKLDTNAMAEQLKRMQKTAKMKETLKKKAELKNAQQLATQLAQKVAQEAQQVSQQNAMSDEELIAYINDDKTVKASGKKKKGKK